MKIVWDKEKIESLGYEPTGIVLDEPTFYEMNLKIPEQLNIMPCELACFRIGDNWEVFYTLNANKNNKYIEQAILP
jgi:hypothetical protein